jgi:alpha-galactosidase
VGYNGQSLTPAMGWSSWNHYGCSGLNETVIEQQATAMSTSGMKAAGYTYINLDDCWMAANRDANGNLVSDPTNFPSGMPALVSYVHNLGLKIGLYEDVGTQTCDGGHPGSYGHYQQDATTFASWGIDYIKMDWCSNSGLDPQTQYTQFSQALTVANANVVYSVCDWGTKQPWSWAAAIANSWRTTPDIADNWLSMINNMEATSALAAFAGPGAWNDPDMLEVGNGGMTDTEYQTHFAMWAMLAAPLISGNDLTSMSAATLATLTNSEVIAVDQDMVGAQGVLLSDNGSGLQVWSRQVADGIVVALLNKSAANAVITANWSDLGVTPSLSVDVRDVWNHVDLGSYTNGISSVVASHGVALLKLEAPSTLTEQTIATNVPAQTVLEADASTNTLSGTAVIQQCPGAWGYSCLDGQEVGYIGNGAGNTITLNDINAVSSGAYNLIFYAAVNGTRNYDVSVNGGAVSALNVTGTSFSIPSASGMTAQLNAGSNTIELSNPSAYAPDLDHIVYSPQGTVTSGFNIAYPTPNVTIASPGQSGTASITLVPTGGFTGKVAISCTLPAGMIGATCAPTTASLSGTSSTVASLTITTTAPTSASLHRESSNGEAIAIASKSVDSRSLKAKSHGTGGFYAILLPIPGLALLGFGFGRKGSWKNMLPALLLLGIISTSLLQIAACGSGGSTTGGGGGGGSCSAVPSVPTGLSASSTTSAGTTLTWNASSVGANCFISGYSVYQNSVLIASPATATYAVTGLSPSTAYNFTVAESDSYGASASTPALSVTTAAAISSTATPAGTYQVKVTATSGSITQDASFQVTVQ